MPKLRLIQGGKANSTKMDVCDPRQHNEHMATYYRATRSFEKFFAKLMQGEAGR